MELEQKSDCSVALRSVSQSNRPLHVNDTFRVAGMVIRVVPFMCTTYSHSCCTKRVYHNAYETETLLKRLPSVAEFCMWLLDKQHWRASQAAPTGVVSVVTAFLCYGHWDYTSYLSEMAEAKRGCVQQDLSKRHRSDASGKCLENVSCLVC